EARGRVTTASRSSAQGSAHNRLTVAPAAPTGPPKDALDEALALGSKTIHGQEDALVQPLVEPQPLLEIGGHVAVRGAAYDPRRHAVRDYAAPDVYSHERVVLLEDLDRHLQDQSGVVDQPPALLPSRLPVEVSGDVHGLVGDDALTGTGDAGQQFPHRLIEVAGDPAHQ